MGRCARLNVADGKEHCHDASAPDDAIIQDDASVGSSNPEPEVNGIAFGACARATKIRGWLWQVDTSVQFGRRLSKKRKAQLAPRLSRCLYSF